MSDYDHDQDLYDNDDDERFYEETVYNEEYYIDRERELIRQSNLDLELEELEERQIREMREECLLRPVLTDLIIAQILGLADILIDGPFVKELSGLASAWRGSTNQRIIHLRCR
jgi:hypothetical protein